MTDYLELVNRVRESAGYDAALQHDVLAALVHPNAVDAKGWAGASRSIFVSLDLATQLVNRCFINCAVQLRLPENSVTLLLNDKRGYCLYAVTAAHKYSAAAALVLCILKAKRDGH